MLSTRPCEARHLPLGQHPWSKGTPMKRTLKGKEKASRIRKIVERESEALGSSSSKWTVRSSFHDGPAGNTLRLEHS